MARPPRKERSHPDRHVFHWFRCTSAVRAEISERELCSRSHKHVVRAQLAHLEHGHLQVGIPRPRSLSRDVRRGCSTRGWPYLGIPVDLTRTVRDSILVGHDVLASPTLDDLDARGPRIDSRTFASRYENGFRWSHESRTSRGKRLPQVHRVIRISNVPSSVQSQDAELGRRKRIHRMRARYAVVARADRVRAKAIRIDPPHVRDPNDHVHPLRPLRAAPRGASDEISFAPLSVTARSDWPRRGHRSPDAPSRTCSTRHRP